MATDKDKAQIPPPPGADATAEELAAYFERFGMNELEDAGYVQELTPAEQMEVDKLAAASKARVAARKSTRTQLNLAMSADQLERFTRYANRKHIPPSTLAKAWVLERLDEEAKGSVEKCLGVRSSVWKSLRLPMVADYIDHLQLWHNLQTLVLPFAGTRNETLYVDLKEILSHSGPVKSEQPGRSSLVFFRKFEFTKIEQAVLDAVAQLLTPRAGELFWKQLRYYNFAQRLWDDKEVNLYRKAWYQLYGVQPLLEELCFPWQREEYKLARVRLMGSQSKSKTTVHLWVVHGHVFSFQFSQSPRKLASDFRIVEAELLHDPMAEQAKGDYNGDAALPGDYRELLDAGTPEINGWKLFRLVEIRSVVDTDANFHMLAEKDGVGALAVQDEDHSGTLYFFDFNSGERHAVGTSLKSWCEKST